MDELDDAKPRLASRLMDSMVVEWSGIAPPITRANAAPTRRYGGR